jgi:hypothetical protein
MPLTEEATEKGCAKTGPTEPGRPLQSPTGRATRVGPNLVRTWVPVDAVERVGEVRQGICGGDGAGAGAGVAIVRL